MFEMDVRDRMEAELWEQFKKGENAQNIRNQLALIDAFFATISRMVAGID